MHENNPQHMASMWQSLAITDHISWFSMDHSMKQSVYDFIVKAIKNNSLYWLKKVHKMVPDAFDTSQLRLMFVDGSDDMVLWMLQHALAQDIDLLDLYEWPDIGNISLDRFPLSIDYWLSVSSSKQHQKGLYLIHYAILFGHQRIVLQLIERDHSRATIEGLLPFELMYLHQYEYLEFLPFEALLPLNSSSGLRIISMVLGDKDANQGIRQKVLHWLQQSLNHYGSIKLPTTAIMSIHHDWDFKQLCDVIKVDEVEGDCGNTLLSTALIQHCLKRFRWLLSQKKWDINAGNQFKVTPLMIACILGQLDAVKMLLKEPNCHINLSCDGDLTALHFAVLFKHHDCVKCLLKERMCKAFTVNVFGQTPLDHAFVHQDREMIQLFDQKQFKDHVHDDLNEISKALQRLGQYIVKKVRWY